MRRNSSTVLPGHFYTMPLYANTTIEGADLKDILLSTGGSILACGRLFNVKTQHLGVDVYKVWLELANP